MTWSSRETNKDMLQRIVAYCISAAALGALLLTLIIEVLR